MFKKQSTSKKLEERIKQFEKETFERGLVEHLPPAEESIQPASNTTATDLVISDIIMPEKEGIETVMEIKRQFPKAKVIVVSGGGWYGTDLDFDMAEKLGAVTIKKPFELSELTAAIQALLD